MKLYNTLTKSVDPLTPQSKDEVSLYACGPTVYDYAHVGNFRTFVMVDVLVRALRYLGYSPSYIMNITDVGHLVSDADTGEDKMQAGARREGKTAWDVARFYEKAFLSDSEKLNLVEPDHRPKPTELIPEQIAMVEELEKKGFTYTITDGVYFDTSKLPDYGKLTGQNRDELLAGARVEENKEKRHPTDFALWKFSGADEGRRDMEWESPWGVGFPGWHIECSVMARKYLGDQIDIHTGGVDHIPVHHTNEIAQSEAATGKVPFAQVWMHGQFLQVDDEKMSKSKHDFATVGDIEKRGIDPLALRYLFFTAHYRAFLNFSWEGLESAQTSLTNLRSTVSKLTEGADDSEAKETYTTAFEEAITNDLNMPQALAVLWDMLKSDLSDGQKRALVARFDQVLGLGLSDVKQGKQYTYEVSGIAVISDIALSDDHKDALSKRIEAKNNKDFDISDKIRMELEDTLKVSIKDTPNGLEIVKI